MCKIQDIHLTITIEAVDILLMDLKIKEAIEIIQKLPKTKILPKINHKHIDNS